MAANVCRRKSGSQANYEALLGLPNNFGQTGFPAIGSNLLDALRRLPVELRDESEDRHADENLKKIWGKHQLAFGGRYRHEKFRLSVRPLPRLNRLRQHVAAARQPRHLD